MPKSPDRILSHRNLIINGNFDFWQRVGGNSSTYSGVGTSTGYAADRFIAGGYTSSASKSVTVQRSTQVPSAAQARFQSLYSLQFTNNSAIALAASDWFYIFEHRVEGYDFAPLHGGKLATISFWVSSSLTGTYPLLFRNGALTRSYATTFTVSQANTWERKQISFYTDTSGAWTFDNTVGLNVSMPFFGSNYQNANLNQWQSVNAAPPAAGLVNFLGTSGAVIRLSQVSLTAGDGSSGAPFSRSGGSFQAELALCQRYYEKSYDVDTAPGTANATAGMITFRSPSSSVEWPVCFKVPKRGIPTTVTWSPVTGAANMVRGTSDGAESAATAGIYQGQYGFFMQRNAAGTAGYQYAFHYTADAEL